MKQFTFSAQVANNLLTVLQRYSSSLRLLLVMLLTLTVSAEVWGADVPITINASQITGFGSGSNYTSSTITIDDITIASSSGFSTTQFRVARSANLVISCAGKMTKIVFTVSGTSYKLNATGIDWSGTTGTYTNASGIESVTFTNSDANIARITKIVITYTTSGGSVTPDPTTYTINWHTAVGSVEDEVLEEGATITKPATDPTMSGYVFMGWTEDCEVASDGAGFTAIEDFGTATENKDYYAVFAVATTTSGGGSSNYEKVTSNLADWAGDYLIAYNNTTFADGRIGGTGTGAMGASGVKVDLSSSISNNTIPASIGDQYNVTLEAVSGGYVLKTKDGKYNYQSSNSNGLTATTNISIATTYAIKVTFTSENDIKLALSGVANGAVFRYNTSGYFRFYKNGGQSAVYLYKKVAGSTTTYDNYITTCATGDPCTDAVTISKGTETNGTFALSTIGQQSTCDGSVTVTLSNIQPATGYQFSEITQSGVDDAKVTIDNTEKTVTYAKNTTGTSTINVTFIEIPKYTVTLNPNYPNGKTGTFKDKGGNTISGNLVQTYDYNTASMSLTDLYQSIELDGYQFNGWFKATSGGSPLTVTGKITEDITLYAQWTQCHYVTWKVNGEALDLDATYTSCLHNVKVNRLPPAPESLCGKVFVGWTTETIDPERNTPPSVLFKISDASPNVTADITYHAVWADEIPGSGGDDVNDVLNRGWTGVSGTGYTDWSGKKLASPAVYAGNSAGGNSSIQLRSDNNNSGIITTTSGGKIKKVVVSWNGSTSSNRTLQIYGKNMPYTSPSELYATETKGDLLGEIYKDVNSSTTTTLEVTGDYSYIGLRSASGAMYLDWIQITWATGTPTTYSSYTTICTPAEPHTVTFNAGSGTCGTESLTESSAGEGVTLPNVTPNAGFSFIGWSTIENGTTADAGQQGETYYPSADITLYAVYVQQYTVTWMVNGEKSHSQSGEVGTLFTDIPEPAGTDCDNDKVFVGWTATPIDGSTNTEPNDLFSSTEAASKTIPEDNVTYYAVFANEGSGSGGAELVKMKGDDDFYIGDKIVIVAEGTQYGLYQNTSTKNYIDYWTIQANDGVPTLAEIEDDSKRYVEISAGTATGTIKLGDATNGYLYNSSSTDMSVSTNNSSDWSIIAWNDDTFTFEAGQYLSCRTDLTSPNTNKWRGAGQNCDCETTEDCSGVIYYNIYKYIARTGSYSDYVTSCCQQPINPLTVNADKTELVKSGVVTLTATGGNGRNIEWTTTGGVLSNQSNTGATLTISDVYATQNITVTATQAVNDDDDLLCAQEASIDITVKAQWTITFWTNDNGEKESNAMTVTDGEPYTMPDISDEYVCNSGSSFAGWVDKEDDTELDAMPNSTQTATADQTWYAAWSSSSATETVDVYQLVTDVANLAAGDKVWITNETPTVAMGIQNTNNRGQVGVVEHPTENDKIYSKGSPATLTIGKDGTDYTFHDGEGYLYAASSSSNHLKTKAALDDNGKWSISITDGKASIIAQGDHTRNTIRYNESNNPPLFSCYASGQKDVKIYKYVGTAEIEVSGASITTNNTSCTRGAVISAENGKWVTSANGQKVRISINVTARGFESNSTLIASSNNEHFKVSVPNSTINASTENITTIVVEYTPVESDIVEMAEITLKADEATKIININGRSLPDEFVIVAQYNDKWLALPANMQSGADQYNGIEVTPNNALTQIPAAPNTTIYSLRGVAETRYETAGVCVRLVGNDNKCLWGNTSNTTTTIQNWTTLSKDNGENYEWLLTTSDGEQYTIACPAHPEYGAGRVLANSGQKYGLYKGTTNFYILPVGCSALPGNVQVSPRRVDVNFAWVSNASSMQIDVWTNEEMTEGKMTQSTANSQYFFSGLKEKTQYWYKLTPDGNDACAVTGTFTTTGPTIDVVEWKENAVVIQVDKDDALNPLVIIDGEVEHGVGGTKATDIFFSKYFEAQSEAKLLAIYNGTANAISLADITILQRSTEHASNYTPLSLAPYGKIPGWIQPGEELILYNEDQSANSEAIMQCAKNDPTFSNWVKVDDVNLEFSGKGTIRLFRGNKCIDIIGAMGSADDIDDIEVNPLEGTEKPTFGDKEGFTTSTGDNYSTTNEETNYVLSTNRCLLVRKPSVTSGAIAVEKNIGDFKTLGNDYDGIENEWAGLQVPNGPSSNKFQYTCEGFQKVGSFDYNKHYKEYNTIDNDTYLKDYSHDVNTNEYTIPIENLANYSCLNLRFQLKQGEEVLTETPVQVPIIVSGQKTTNDAIFNAIVKDDETPLHTESIERCKTCNVVVLSEATLTKATDETTNDVAQVHNVKVYPGGKLVIPEGTNYNINSLSFRRQEEEVASAELKGNLNITASSEKPIYVDVRVNAENWHWFTLPYDCNIADVTWVDGTPAKYGVDWFLSTYDGEKRAATQSGGCWAEFHGTTLKAGVGYIVGIVGHPTKSKVKYELRFPMSKEVLAQEVAGTDKTVPVYAWGVDEDMRPTHKGWNLVGNPYLNYYQKDKLNTFNGLRLGGEYVLNTSTGYWEDSGEWNGVTQNCPYVVVPVDGGWSAYNQVLVSETDLLPFTSYFVQVGNPETENNGEKKDVMFDGDNRGRASIARRAPSSVNEPDEPVIVGVSLTNAKGESDKTSLVIDNKYTDEYEMNADFFKWFGDYYRYYTKPVVYTIGADKQQRAFNALNEEQAAKPVSMGTYTAQNGEYTFSLDRRSDLTRVKEVWLHDATESAYINLMQEDYSFSTGKTDGTGRFTLSVTLHPKSPTDITDGMNGQVYVTSQQRMLYVNNLPQQARVWVYDAVGKLLVNESTNVYQRAYHVGQAGVYFVRVESQNGCETLQAVVE